MAVETNDGYGNGELIHHNMPISANKCHKCKDVRYLNASPEFNEKVAKDTAKSVWKAGNNLCTCKSALWLWIGIGTVIAILAGIGGYFWWKNSQKNKEGEEE